MSVRDSLMTVTALLSVKEKGITGGIFPRLLAHPFIPHIYLCLFAVWLSTLVIGNTLPSVY